MSKLGKFFAVLFRGQTIERPDDALTEQFEATKARLDAAQSDFARVVREVLDQNERLRSRNVPPPPNPRA